MSDDLLPCPFCGGSKLGKTSHGLPMQPCVICLDCHASTTSVAAWNRRALPAVTLPDNVAKVVEEAGKVADQCKHQGDKAHATIGATSFMRALWSSETTIRALTAIITAQAAQIASVLQREAEAYARHDAKMEAAETALAAEREKVAKLVEALKSCPPTSNPTVSAQDHLERINAWWRLTARDAITEAGQ